MSMSFDGFVSRPDGKNDWIFKTGDEKSKAWALAQTDQAGLIIMGRKSFEAMAPYWVTSTDAFAPAMNSMPKAVFTQRGYKGFDPGGSASAAHASWAQARVFDGDLGSEIGKLKAEEGKPIVAIYTRQGIGYMNAREGKAEAPLMWKWKWVGRPGTQILFHACKQVLVRDITVRNANDWTMDLNACDDAKVLGISIDNNMSVPNSDGVDMYDSRNVIIADCDIRAGMTR